jgi:hypothetical protein
LSDVINVTVIFEKYVDGFETRVYACDVVRSPPTGNVVGSVVVVALDILDFPLLPVT